MSYHHFSNMRELFQGDLNTKLNRNIISKDFQNLPCNCRNKQACPYAGKCRHSIVVYATKQYVSKQTNATLAIPSST